MAHGKVSGSKLQRLTEADYVLDACGRPVPPKGYRFVDLPYVIPFHFDDVVPVPLPTNSGIFNSARVVFLCRGIVVRSDFRWRIKWPSGRFLSQGMEFDAIEQASPQGVGSSLIAFSSEIPIGPDQRITVQLNA
jgi:hypothetical protein